MSFSLTYVPRDNSCNIVAAASLTVLASNPSGYSVDLLTVTCLRLLFVTGSRPISMRKLHLFPRLRKVAIDTPHYVIIEVADYLLPLYGAFFLIIYLK